MCVHTQKAAFTVDSASRCLAHGRRGARRSKHFTQFLTCRTTPQKVQTTTHSAAKSSYPSWFRKHPQLHMAAEMARSPAAPGLLFTAAAVQGFSVVSEVVSNLADKASVRAEELGTGLTRQLQRASDSAAVQTEISQTSFQEWKSLMNGILSEEASKVQADLDHASKAAAAWQQQSSEVVAQIREGISSKPDLRAHPLGLPPIKLPELQSGWLADALHQRLAEAGSSSAWPTSFSVAAGSDTSSDSMSVSDDEDSKAAPLPNFMSSFIDQAKDLTARFPEGPGWGPNFLDRKGSELGSAATDLATSIYTKVAQFPGQGLGVSNFSPRSSPDRFSGNVGQTGPSGSRQLPKPARLSTGLLPSPAKASTLLTAPASSTAALPAAPAAPTPAALPSPDKPIAALPLPASAPAAALPSPAAKPASLHMAHPARKAATQRGGPLSPRASPLKAMKTSLAVLASVKTAKASRHSMIQTSPSSKPHAVKASDKPSAATLQAGQSPSSSSGASAAARHASSASVTQSPSATPSPASAKQSSSGSAIPSHLPSSASSSQSPAAARGLASAVPAAPSSSAVPVAAGNQSGKPGHGIPPATADSGEPSATSRAAGLPTTVAAKSQGVSATSTNDAQAPVDSTGDAHTAVRDAHVKEGALQAKGDSHWAKGDALQAEGQASQLGGVGGQHMPDAAEPKAAGDSTQSPGDRVQQHESSTGSMQAHSLSDDSGPSKEPEQPQEQGKAKTPVRRVRVLRPEPTPNWRSPRPLTPPPAPVQQGHPLSASPAQAAASQKPPAQHRSPASDSAGPSQDEHAAAQPPATTSSVSEATDQSNLVKQPTAAAAATAVDSSTTTVIDSIPWGSSGTATTRSRQDGMPGSPQAGGGSGSITGGSTGGGGGGSPRPSGDSGGEAEGPRSSSTWGQWWFKLLLVGGGATAISMSSTARTAISDAVSALRARLTPAKMEEQHHEEEEEGEVQAEEQEGPQESEHTELQADAPAAFSTPREDGIATNIKIKEGDTAWSIAEEYRGSGQAWPEVVSSNPHANMAKPATGMTVRVAVRIEG